LTILRELADRDERLYGNARDLAFFH
jgi:hypothetical protein